MVDNARELLPEIRTAGSVFLGNYSPVALGDYLSGPSHVLPTGGAAARHSGLSAQDFRRTMNVISYSAEGLHCDAPLAGLLTRLEGLSRHASSLEIRDRGNK